MKRFLALLCTVATTLTLVGCNDAAPSTSSDSVNKQDEDMVNESQGNEGGNNGLSGILGEDNGIFEEEAPTGMILTINGNEYDLTGHFNETIADMVQDGLVVKDSEIAPSSAFDETGYTFSGAFRNLSDEEKAKTVNAGQMESRDQNATLTYYISTQYNNSLEFKTPNGISENFTIDDLLDLEGFVPILTLFPGSSNFWSLENNEYICAALYVDGKMVDIFSYEETAEDILEDTSLMAGYFFEEGEPKVPDFMTNILFSVSPEGSLLDSIPLENTELYEKCKYTLMLLLAERDAYLAIQEGECEYMCLISYFYFEHESLVAYQLYGTDFTPRREWKDHVE